MARAADQVPSVVDEVRRALQFNRLGPVRYLTLGICPGITLRQVLNPPTGAALEDGQAHLVFQFADGLNGLLLTIGRLRRVLSSRLRAEQNARTEQPRDGQFSH